MPHATMERRHQPGVGSGGQNRPMYYTLQPSNRGYHGQDNYGSLPSQGSVSIGNYGGNNFNTLPTQTIGGNQPSTVHGTVPRNASPLPSYNNFNSLPRQSSGYNSLPPQQGNYGTLPTHHEYKSQTLPHQTRDVSQRQLPPPSLSRHTVKVLQVPILVVGEGGNSAASRATPVVPSPSHSPSSSSTISDPPAAPSPTLRGGGGSQGLQAQKPVHHRPGYVHPNSQQPQMQQTSQFINEPPIQGFSSRPPSSQGFSSGPSSTQGFSSRPPSSQGFISGQPSTQGFSSRPHSSQGFSSGPPSTQGFTSGPPSSQGISSRPPSSQGFSSGPPPSQGFSSGPPPSQGFSSGPPSSQGFSSGSSSLGPQAKVYPQATSSHDYTNVGTWSHPRAIPNHIQHPSPSPSPTSSTISATLPHPHHHQHHHSVIQPPRPSPVPTPLPQTTRNNSNASVHVHAPPPHPQHNTELAIQQRPSQAPAQRIPNTNTNGQSSNPSSKGLNQDNNAVQPHGNHDDFSYKIREMQSEMERMQKQMESQFRNMHMGGPPNLGNQGFPEFPPMINPPFGSLPSSMDNMHSQSSLNTLSTPPIMEPNFSTMMSNDIGGGGGPLIEEGAQAKGGKKQLKLNLDMHDFTPEEVKVKSDKNKLEVTAHHEEKDPNRVTCRVFHQQYHLPPNVRMAKMKYDMTPAGELKVEGTVKPRHRVKWAEDTLTK